MNNQRQKPTKRKAKPPQHEKKYMPFRAYKAKGIESKVAGYVKARRTEVEILKPNVPQRFEKINDTSSQEEVLKRDKGGKSAEMKKSKIVSKNQSAAKSPKKSKITKSFDIDSFPRVFSTSDLMEKMNEDQAKSSKSSCNFQRSYDVENTEEVTAPNDEFQVHMLPKRNKDEEKEFGEINFLGSDLMVFSRKRQKRRNALEDKLTKTMYDLETRNNHMKSLTSKLEETSQSLESSTLKEKNLLIKIEQRELQLGKLHLENETLKKEKAKYEKMAKELQISIQNLEKELQKTKHAKEHERQQEYTQLKELINELETEREKYNTESKKLKRELKEKNEIIEVLNQRCENLNKSHLVATNHLKKDDQINIVDSLQEQMMKLKRENEKLKKTYAYAMSELADYDMIQLKLKQVISKQKNSLKLLEDVSISETQQLQNYEMENIRLREMNKNLWSENERYKLENGRLLHTLTELPSDAFIKPQPPRIQQRRMLYLTNTDKTPKDAIKEIKNFKASILQAFRQHQKSDV